MQYYTYAYLREDRTPYYIGKGKGYRLYDKRHKVSIPTKNRIIYLKQNLTENEAFKHEIYMIAVFGRKDLGTGILRNKTDGGEGPSNIIRTEEHMNALMKGRINYTFTDEVKQKISRTLKNNDIKPPLQTGKKWWYSINGKETLSIECPGKEWKLGRPSLSKRLKENNPQWTRKKLAQDT
jgi:hypothetical protein